jgi:ATP-dependent Lon protease
MAVLIGVCSSILEGSVKGGLILVGQLDLGGSLDTIYDAVNLAELAVEKGATTLLIPLKCRETVK